MSDRQSPAPEDRETVRADRNGAQPMEVEARLLLSADGDQGPEEIENAMMKVIEALEGDAAGVAHDLVGSCNLVKREIELEFTIEAQTAAGVHRCLGHVVEVIEREVPIAREVASETRAAEPELAVA